MEPAAMDRIEARLSAVDGLYFLTSFLRATPSPPQRKAASSLSSPATPSSSSSATAPRCPPASSCPSTRSGMTTRSAGASAACARRPAGARVRNRRRAFLDRLVREGEYFSEEAMREREPYLHHEYLGRFQDPIGRAMARSGERWSKTLVRRAEEAVILEKIQGEQIRWGVDPSEWVGGGVEEAMQELEEEEEEEEEEEDAGMEEKGKKTQNLSATEVVAHEDTSWDPNNAGGSPAGTFKQTLSAEEMQDQLEQFTSVMQQKFLSGEDSSIYMDYPRIDNDEMLDDHWSQEANNDAEEKYFEED